MIKRIFYTTLVFIALTMMLTVTASAQEYIVKMKDNGVMLFGGDVEPLYAPQNLYVTDEETANELLESGMAERISRNFTIELFSTGYENLYSEEFTKCPSLNTINAEAAWNYETFGNDIIVGVIDSGCFKHSELEDRLLPGKNFVDGSDNTTDTLGHGTHVSGIIAAALNGDGVAGAAPKTKIVPLRCFISGSTSAGYIISAIYAGVDTYDCQILNMSFGFDITETSQITPEDAEELKIAIDYAVSQGVIVIAAVGNDGRSDKNSVLKYPAAWDNVIGVGAVDINKKVCSFSQKNNTVSLCAPGDGENFRDGIFSLGIGETEDTKYALKYGTSMACPYVSAAVAIALSFDPTITPAEMKTLLTSSTVDAIVDSGEFAGAGVLNVELLVQNLLEGKDAYTSPLKETENGLSSTVFDLTGNGLNASAIWYDKDSGSVSENPFSVTNGSIELTTPLTSARLFVWNSLNGMIPLTQPR